MATNEDTLYQKGQHNEKDNSTGTTQKQSSSAVKNGSSTWKRVTVGGASGILLGAGGAFAASYFTQAHAAEVQPHQTPNNVDALHVAHVNDTQSFHEAFDAARAQVGAGGAFHWHGGIYSTFTANEWNGMSAQQRDAYAHRVAPEVHSSEAHGAQAGQATVEVHQTHDVPGAHDGDVSIHHSGATQTHAEVATHPDVAVHQAGGEEDGGHTGGDVDVQIVGTEEMQLSDGSMATVGVAEVDGHDVYVVDVNHDGTFDLGAVDQNGNGVIDQNETFNIQDQHLQVSDFEHQVDATHDQVDVQTDHGLADGMPDYVNDADPSGLA